MLRSPVYNALNWYWLSSDGRLFSSLARGLVPSTNSDYLAWVARGNAATPWPRDNSGNQTSAALGDVLAPYGISVS